MTTDLYEILGIKQDATPEQIRQAYRSLILKFHPDRLRPEEQAGDKFIQVQNAYEVLSDPEKRQSYDRHRAGPPPAEDPPRYPQRTTRAQPPHHADPFIPNPYAFPPGPWDFPGLIPTPATFPFPGGGPLGPFGFGVGMGGGLFPGIFPLGPSVPPRMGGPHFHSHGTGNKGSSASFVSSTFSNSANQRMGGSGWISESYSTSTINGFTTIVHELVDPFGNTHTMTTHPNTRVIRGASLPSLRPRDPLHPHPYPPRSHRHDSQRNRGCSCDLHAYK